MRPKDFSRVLKNLEELPFFNTCVTKKVCVPSQPGQFKDFPETLSEPLKNILSDRGITKLYCHQEEAFLQVSRRRRMTLTM